MSLVNCSDVLEIKFRGVGTALELESLEFFVLGFDGRILSLYSCFQLIDLFLQLVTYLTPK